MHPEELLINESENDLNLDFVLTETFDTYAEIRDLACKLEAECQHVENRSWTMENNQIMISSVIERSGWDSYDDLKSELKNYYCPEFWYRNDNEIFSSIFPSNTCLTFPDDVEMKEEKLEYSFLQGEESTMPKRTSVLTDIYRESANETSPLVVCDPQSSTLYPIYLYPTDNQVFCNESNEANDTVFINNSYHQQIDLKDLMVKSKLTIDILKQCNEETINKRYSESRTLLHLSIAQDDLKSFRELLQHQAIEIAVQDFAGNTVLHYIGKMSDTDKQLHFLDTLHKSSKLEHIAPQLNKDFFLKKDVKGDTVLHLLTRIGDVNVINMMLEICGSFMKELINSQDCRDLKTPLTIASELKNWELMKYLLSKGADPNIGTLSNMKPIHFTCGASNIEMVKLLYEYGADCNQRLAKGGNEKNMTSDKEILLIIETQMKKARNNRAKLKRKMNRANR